METKRSTDIQDKNDEVKNSKLMVVIVHLEIVAVANALQLEAVRCLASRFGLFLANYVLRMRMLGLFSCSGQNSDVAIGFSDPQFPKRVR